MEKISSEDPKLHEVLEKMLDVELEKAEKMYVSDSDLDAEMQQEIEEKDREFWKKDAEKRLADKKRKRNDSDSEVDAKIRRVEEERKEEDSQASDLKEWLKELEFWEDINEIHREFWDRKECWEEIQKLCKSMQKEENESMEENDEKKKRKLQLFKEIAQNPRSADLEDRLEREMQDWYDENYAECRRCGSFLLNEEVGLESCMVCMDEDRRERVNWKRGERIQRENGERQRKREGGGREQEREREK